MAAHARRLSLVMREEPNRYGNQSGYRMDLEGVEAPRLNSGPVPGPVIVLTRGEPVEITLVNRMTEPTAIHWHGIELDSYFDGVPGLGGEPGNLTPPVDPGQSFVAKFTPPRAGTFIYHTHWHKDAQLAGGLYGPLIVLEPGERYDPETDHIVVIGLERRPAGERAGAVRAQRQRDAGAHRHARGRAQSPAPHQHHRGQRRADGVPCRSVRADDVETAGEGRCDAAAAADRAPTGAPARVGRRDLRLRNSAVARRNCCGWKCAVETGSGCCRRRSGFASRGFWIRKKEKSNWIKLMITNRLETDAFGAAHLR